MQSPFAGVYDVMRMLVIGVYSNFVNPAENRVFVVK